MGFLVFLIIILIIGGWIFINIKISNLKHRGRQEILRNTGISSSAINASLTESLEKKHLQSFLKEHPIFTEDSIKELLKKYAIEIIKQNSIEEFSQLVNEKIQKDSKIQKLVEMKIERVNINYYKEPKLNAVVIFTDNKDEYNMFLNCTLINDKLHLDRYQIAKGAVVGF